MVTIAFVIIKEIGMDDKEEILSKVAAAYRRGKENLVIFRNLFLPGRNDVESPWFPFTASQHEYMSPSPGLAIK